ncbi:hypothetical protein ACA910_011581 [Epithemia clementina (nom. ined.)]
MVLSMLSIQQQAEPILVHGYLSSSSSNNKSMHTTKKNHHHHTNAATVSVDDTEPKIGHKVKENHPQVGGEEEEPQDTTNNENSDNFSNKNNNNSDNKTLSTTTIETTPPVILPSSSSSSIRCTGNKVVRWNEAANQCYDWNQETTAGGYYFFDEELMHELWYTKSELNQFYVQYEKKARQELLQSASSQCRAEQWKHAISTVYKSGTTTLNNGQSTAMNQKSHYNSTSSSLSLTTSQQKKAQDKETDAAAAVSNQAQKLSQVYLQAPDLVGIEGHLLTQQCRTEGSNRRKNLYRAVFQQQPYNASLFFTQPQAPRTSSLRGSSSFILNHPTTNNNPRHRSLSLSPSNSCNSLSSLLGKDKDATQPAQPQHGRHPTTSVRIIRKLSRPSEHFAQQIAQALALSLAATNAAEEESERGGGGGDAAAPGTVTASAACPWTPGNAVEV